MKLARTCTLALCVLSLLLGLAPRANAQNYWVCAEEVQLWHEDKGMVFINSPFPDHDYTRHQIARGWYLMLVRVLRDPNGTFRKDVLIDLSPNCKLESSLDDANRRVSKFKDFYNDYYAGKPHKFEFWSTSYEYHPGDESGDAQWPH